MAGRWTFVLVIALACAMVTGENAADGEQVETMQSSRDYWEAKERARRAANSRSADATNAATAAIAAEMRAVEASRVKAADDIHDFRGYQHSKEEFLDYVLMYEPNKHVANRMMDDLFKVVDTNRDNHLSPLVFFGAGMTQKENRWRNVEFSIYFWEMVRWMEGDGKGVKEKADDDDDEDFSMEQMAVKYIKGKPVSRADWLTYFREHGYKIPEEFMTQLFHQFDKNLDNELSGSIVFGACLLSNQERENREMIEMERNCFSELVKWTEGNGKGAKLRKR